MAKKKQKSILNLSITSQHELEEFKDEIFKVAESKKNQHGNHESPAVVFGKGNKEK